MNQFNVQSTSIVEQATTRQFEERQQLRQAREDAHRQASALEQFASQVSSQSEAQSFSPFTSAATPPAELQATLQQLEKSVAEIQRLQTGIREQYAAIEEIKRRARNLKYTLIGVGAVVVLIVFIIILHAL